MKCNPAIEPHLHRADCPCGSMALSRRSALRLGLGAAAVGSALLSARGLRSGLVYAAWCQEVSFTSYFPRINGGR